MQVVSDDRRLRRSKHDPEPCPPTERNRRAEVRMASAQAPYAAAAMPLAARRCWSSVEQNVYDSIAVLLLFAVSFVVCALVPPAFWYVVAAGGVLAAVEWCARLPLEPPRERR
jgi:hypothetical protein